MARKLNKRQLAYCYYRARGYTIEQSMSKAGYTCVGGSARATGSQLEQNPNIKSRIEYERLNIFDMNKINLEYLVEKASKIITDGEYEANKLRAIEIVAKLTGNWIDKQIDKVTFTSEEQHPEAVKERLNSLGLN